MSTHIAKELQFLKALALFFVITSIFIYFDFFEQQPAVMDEIKTKKISIEENNEIFLHYSMISFLQVGDKVEISANRTLLFRNTGTETLTIQIILIQLVNESYNLFYSNSLETSKKNLLISLVNKESNFIQKTEFFVHYYPLLSSKVDQERLFWRVAIPKSGHYILSWFLVGNETSPNISNFIISINENLLSSWYLPISAILVLSSVLLANDIVKLYVRGNINHVEHSNLKKMPKILFKIKYRHPLLFYHLKRLSDNMLIVVLVFYLNLNIGFFQGRFFPKLYVKTSFDTPIFTNEMAIYLLNPLMTRIFLIEVVLFSISTVYLLHDDLNRKFLVTIFSFPWNKRAEWAVRLLYFILLPLLVILVPYISGVTAMFTIYRAMKTFPMFLVLLAFSLLTLALLPISLTFFLIHSQMKDSESSILSATLWFGWGFFANQGIFPLFTSPAPSTMFFNDWCWYLYVASLKYLNVYFKGIFLIPWPIEAILALFLLINGIMLGLCVFSLYYRLEVK